MEGFRKKSFLKKILPDTTSEIGFCFSLKYPANLYGWRFFLKPAGLELFFLNTWNLPLLSFFYFIFLLSEQDFPFEVGSFCFGVGVVLQGFQILGSDKKQKSIINAFVRNRNLKLLLLYLIFCGA